MTDAKWEKTKKRLEREFGPDFDEMPDRELRIIAASNAFHNGRALKELKNVVLLIALIVIAMAMKVFGWADVISSWRG